MSFDLVITTEFVEGINAFVISGIQHRVHVHLVVVLCSGGRVYLVRPNQVVVECIWAGQTKIIVMFLVACPRKLRTASRDYILFFIIIFIHIQVKYIVIYCGGKTSQI